MEEKKEEKSTPKSTKKQEQKPAIPTWFEFLLKQEPPEKDIKERLVKEVKEIETQYAEDLKDTCIVYIFDNNYDIDSITSDRIYTSLLQFNKDKNKNILLLISSRGGRIEPAYQTSKICKKFSKETFTIVVPRAAKSAATLICLGADQIHMGLLSELGPIDPQHFGRPVLGLRYSLEQIAEICEKHPGSSQMFSEYLTKSLYVPNIGYYERLGESAEQYAQRLLSGKNKKAAEIAKLLVYDYKDHGFVIDVDEAQKILGDLIKTETKELKFSEDVYQLLDLVDFLLSFQERTLRVIGDINSMFITRLPKKPY